MEIPDQPDADAKKAEAEELVKQKDDAESKLKKYEKETEEKQKEFEKQAEEWAKQFDSIKNEYDEAQRIIADSKNATVQAEAEAQLIILNAEKQAVFLKDVALSESEKGAMQKTIEEKEKLLAEKEQKIAEMESQKKELEKKIAELDKAVKELEVQMRESIAAVAAAGGGASDAGPKEYALELIPHNSVGEVDAEGIQKILRRKAADGWTLISVINDEGGKLQSSLGGSEASSSLSVGAFQTKEDRVILIFSRPKK